LYRSAKIHRLAESIPQNPFLGSLTFTNMGLASGGRGVLVPDCYKSDLKFSYSGSGSTPTPPHPNSQLMEKGSQTDTVLFSMMEPATSIFVDLDVEGGTYTLSM
jgi:hypothetical protein